ncbi:MAG: aminotransferase class V-fold PLP-dependent enzyme [Flavobacteriales bacterium]|nr:MAG: aminotransferase class V-fold PLP-dependent enzyme [Flavobacteriales bacterium]
MTITDLDVSRARALTPGCDNVIHFNNAGCGLMSQPVLDTVLEHTQLEARMGSYEAAAAKADALNAVYASFGKLLNCHADEVALTDGATQSWHRAFHSVPLGKGDRVLTANNEYNSNWLSLRRRCDQVGASLEVVPSDTDGLIDVDALKRMLDERVKLVAITQITNSNGKVNPVAEVGAAVKTSNAIYLLDACQAVGQMPVDFARIGCDMLTGAGRKFLRGPRGTGFMVVRRAVLDRLDPMVIDIHSAKWTGRDTFEWQPGARRFEVMEFNIADRLGMGAAVDHALGWGLDNIEARILGLSTLLRERLNALPGVQVRDQGTRPSGINTFTIEGADLQALLLKLRAQGINTSVTNFDWAWLDLKERGIESIMRASLHYYNTEEEVERFAEAIARR